MTRDRREQGAWRCRTVRKGPATWDLTRPM